MKVAEAQGFTAFGKVFDSDTSSIQRITLLAQSAQSADESYTREWTCADNSVVVLTKAQILSLPSIIADASNALHVKTINLKALVDSATTVEGINLIQWI